MLRVVVLCVGILSVVWATPFDLDSVDRPTPFRYTFRVEKVEFGNDAISEDSEYEDDYEIGTFESDENSNFIDESDESRSEQALTDLFGDLEQCELMNLQTPPKDGCLYVADGNVYLLNILSTVDIEDVYKAFKDNGIEECEGGDDVSDLTEDGCFSIDEDNASVIWFGAYHEDMVDEVGNIDDLKDKLNNLDKCDVTATEVPEEGCALLDEEGLHFINVLTEDNVDDVMRALSELGIRECIFDEDYVLITTEPCYKIDEDINGVDFLNYAGLPEGDDDDDYDYSEETYTIPSEMVTPPSLVQTATANGHLKKMKLKGLFNQRSSVANKAKAFHAKKIHSRKQPQEVQKILGRRGHQHGRHGNNVHKVNHHPKWMKYLRKNA